MITGYQFESLSHYEQPILTLTNGSLTDAYIVRNIEGLAPSPVIIDSSANRTRAGDTVTSVRGDIRELTLTVSPNPYIEKSVHTLRSEFHERFTPGRGIRTVVIYSTGARRVIDGIVKTHEANIYSEEPLFQVVIHCEDPYFKDETPTEVAIPTFHLESTYTSPIYTPDTDYHTDMEFSLYMGDVIGSSRRITRVNIDHVIAWDGGFVWRSMRVEMPEANALRRSDALVLGTHNGRKTLTRFGTGGGHNLIPFITTSSISRWPVVGPGRNQFRLSFQYTGSASAPYNVGPGTISYTNRYAGA